MEWEKISAKSHLITALEPRIQPNLADQQIHSLFNRKRTWMDIPQEVYMVNMEWKDTVNVTLRPSGWLYWTLHNWRLGLRKMPASIHPPVRPSHSTQVTSNRTTAETMAACSSARRCRKTQNTSYSACVKARKTTQPGCKITSEQDQPWTVDKVAGGTTVTCWGWSLGSTGWGENRLLGLFWQWK